MTKTGMALLICGAITFNAVGELPVAEIGNLDQLHLYSPEMHDTITIDVWTPPGYDSSAGYPVIYMHDGQNLFDSTTTWNSQAWEVDRVLGVMVERGEAAPAIVVGIHSDGATRVADLMPRKAVEGHGMEATLVSAGQAGTPVRGDDYARFIVETLKPAIDARYATLPDRGHTAVAGSSMGGLMSVYALCEYPDIFGSALCLSTHWIGAPDVADDFSGAMMGYLDTHLPDPDTHRLYFDHGTATIDALYGPAEERITQMIRSKGYRDGHLLTLTFPGAAHQESDWSTRLHIPLTFLLGQ